MGSIAMEHIVANLGRVIRIKVIDCIRTLPIPSRGRCKDWTSDRNTVNVLTEKL